VFRGTKTNDTETCVTRGEQTLLQSP